MFETRIAVIAVSSMLVAGCAIQPKGISDSHMALIRERGLVVDSVKGASSVQVKTKGMAIGGAVLGTVAGSVVGSNPASMSAQGIGEAQQLGMQTSAMVQRGISDATGHVGQERTPALVMRDAIGEQLSALGVSRDARSFRVNIQQSLWQLSYDSMFGGDNYRLHYEMESSVIGQDGKAVMRSICRGDGEEKKSLDAWRADDYAKVKLVAEEIGASCAKKLLMDVGLKG